MNLVPTTTGSARAITQIFPELEGLLDGRAVRIPLAVGGSIVDMVLEVKRPTSVSEVNAALQAAALGDTGRPSLGSSASPAKGRTLAGILGYEERPLVSTDYTNESRSGVVDAGSTMVTDGTLVKLYVWYDNEWGVQLPDGGARERVVAEMQKATRRAFQRTEMQGPRARARRFGFDDQSAFELYFVFLGGFFYTVLFFIIVSAPLV